MRAEPLAGGVLGGPGDGFVLAQWTAEVGKHWIAPLHVHHEDDEAWYLLRGRLEFRLGDEAFEVGPGSAVFARRGHRIRGETPGTSRLSFCS
jgi:mannose-6-phosphate isomerase-like protein (cupin superfamily)